MTSYSSPPPVSRRYPQYEHAWLFKTSVLVKVKLYMFACKQAKQRGLIENCSPDSDVLPWIPVIKYRVSQPRESQFTTSALRPRYIALRYKMAAVRPAIFLLIFLFLHLSSIECVSTYDEIVQYKEEYTLPDLPYSYDALEPFIDEATMRVHHLGHHAAYTKKLNAALKSWRESVSTPETLFSV